MYWYAIAILVIVIPTINAQTNVQANQQTIFEFLSSYSKTTRVNFKTLFIAKQNN
jgi:hypothetical protein